jgi:hypothetical protein
MRKSEEGGRRKEEGGRRKVLEQARNDWNKVRSGPTLLAVSLCTIVDTHNKHTSSTHTYPIFLTGSGPIVS